VGGSSAVYTEGFSFLGLCCYDSRLDCSPMNNPHWRGCRVKGQVALMGSGRRVIWWRRVVRGQVQPSLFACSRSSPLTDRGWTVTRATLLIDSDGQRLTATWLELPACWHTDVLYLCFLLRGSRGPLNNTALQFSCLSLTVLTSRSTRRKIKLLLSQWRILSRVSYLKYVNWPILLGSPANLNQYPSYHISLIAW